VKEPLLLGFSSVRVLTKLSVWFEFFTCAENLGSVLIFSVLSSVQFSLVLYELGCLMVLLTVPQYRSMLFVNWCKKLKPSIKIMSHYSPYSLTSKFKYSHRPSTVCRLRHFLKVTLYCILEEPVSRGLMYKFAEPNQNLGQKVRVRLIDRFGWSSIYVFSTWVLVRFGSSIRVLVWFGFGLIPVSIMDLFLSNLGSVTHMSWERHLAKIAYMFQKKSRFGLGHLYCTVYVFFSSLLVS